MLKTRTYSYEFGDINQLKRTLLAGKKAIFKDIGTFYLETYEKDSRYIKFKPDSELKNIIWEVLYYGQDRTAKECSDIANQLINLQTIDLVNFGKVYVYFDPGYYTWHDFHEHERGRSYGKTDDHRQGSVWVDPKPRIKFLKHENFKIYNEKPEKTAKFR